MPVNRAPDGPEIIQYQHRPGVLDLGWGHPSPELLPVAGWSRAVATAADTFGWQTLTYGHSSGPAPLVDWLTAHLRRIEGGDSDTSQLFVTAGASHALSLLCGVLAEPGDVVLVDSPTYHLAFRILADRGVRLVGVPTDHQGVDPDGLSVLLRELRAAGQRVAFCYLVPTFGNPTGRSLPEERRHALVRLAERESLRLVEDDTYRELAYDEPAPPSLWRLSGGASVVRIGSFSKTVAPGLRLGWINAEPALVQRLVGLGYIHSGGGVNHATALAMAVFAADGSYDTHVSAARRHYRHQRDTLVTALKERLPFVRLTAPAGGWFLWLPLPTGLLADRLLAVAERHGTSFVPGSRFYVQPDAGRDHIRLSFSHLCPDDLVRATSRLAAAVEECLR